MKVVLTIERVIVGVVSELRDQRRAPRRWISEQHISHIGPSTGGRVRWTRLREDAVERERTGHVAIAVSGYQQAPEIEACFEIMAALALRKKGRDIIVDEIVPRMIAISQ